MGKGRPRAVQKGVVGQNLSVSPSGSLHVPLAPVYYPTEEEFKDPLQYVYKIRPEAEKYGICKIVPPKSWLPPFALNLDSFSFPTKTQAIHQLQVRPASCDSKTFELEYNRFLEDHFGKKLKKRVVFEGEELDLCKLFNAVKRFGGYDKVVNEKKWQEVSRFVRSGKKISECAKHVLCQLYREHLYDYEKYINCLNKGVAKSCKRGMQENKNNEDEVEASCSKKRRKNVHGEKVKVCNKAEEEELDQICEQCKSGLHGEVMLLCDRCNKGWHIYCLSPPLKQIPLGNWYCFECLNSDKDIFGFVPGKWYTVEAFRRVAERAKKKWFGAGTASKVQIEKKFWEIVEGSAGEVEVMYGSDLDTSALGSGFPRLNDQRPESVDAKLWDEYCGNPWNLNNLPKLKGSILQAVHQNITGVMVPWLYVGMLFSSFCWHFEDHCFYSMNYLHWGEPKCWYSVPGSEANAFEKVMRNSLPDLFDAQPDLLFQLVTMLSPSVLQENGVPVFSVLQEPGNFVITFPRSYHAGFNFGLNCAEAVNFAPADWLPHGRFAAELYQMYHKPAVLSHEELICVVAKGVCNSKLPHHLKKELLGIYNKEKTWRGKLWRSGIINSSPMPPRKCPENVGTEEDPTCIICKQYLYLSAVVCHCRPSAFVCLEHWEHICECKTSRLRLHYRHTLAELSNMVLEIEKNNYQESPQNESLWRQISCSHESNALTKKVKGGYVKLAELAEEWLLRSSKVFENPYSGDAFSALLKEAEQFLWAGSEMDPVRDAVKNLIVAQKWADGIRDCLFKVQNWSCHHNCDMERVALDYVNELLSFDPVPCNESGHLKLKDHAEKARLLTQEIDYALSSCSNISELESLYSRACGFPIYVKESEKLSQRISSAKAWIESARKCISDEGSGIIYVDILYKLKSEILELQVQLPEAEMLLDLIRQAELCQAQCNEILESPCNLKDVEVFLQEWGNFTVNVQELMLLKQYNIDAVSWIARYNNLLVNVHEREDQDKVVNELNCLLKDGASLRIHVHELPHLEIELKKACCRENALKARDTKMPLNFVHQLLVEAADLQIEGEKLFVHISGVLAAAMCWEERATKVLASESQMSDLEDLIRSSTDIPVILPLLDQVEDAVATAKSWLKNSEAFLVSASSLRTGSCSLLQLGALKDLVMQAKLLKISLEEQKTLEKVLKTCEEWEQVVCSVLDDVECVFETSYIGDGNNNGLLTKIEILVNRIESVTTAGLSLGFDFLKMPKLQNAYSALQWCTRALTFCSHAPSFEDVESLAKAAENLSATTVSGALWASLFDGIKWLRKALKVISLSESYKTCKLSDAEEVLAESQGISISFPAIVDQLVNSIQKHKLWQDQVHELFSQQNAERSWSLILELKELGKAAAYSCSELDMILSEVERVEKWKQQCMKILGRYIDNVNPLLSALQKIKQSLDICLYIYGKSDCCEARSFCMCCTSCSDQEIITCSSCKDCYHFQCLESELLDVRNAKLYVCSYCHFFEAGSTFRNGGGPMSSGESQPELGMLIESLSDAENFCVRIEERDALQQVVKQALECKTCLREVLDYALSFLDKDLSIVSRKLIIALKAMKVAGVYDHQDNCDLELALVRNSWKVRVNRLLEGEQKPTMQQIQQHIKEGVIINIPPEDYFRQKLIELKRVGLQWAHQAKKVATDSGALGLDKVFKLISEGENLPLSLEKELQSLRDRTKLYCICRKPYDKRSKVCCVRCDEWYHLDCIKLLHSPKVYVCPACQPGAEELSIPSLLVYERSTCMKSMEPKTPSPQQTKLRNQPNETDPSLVQKMLANTNISSLFSGASGIDGLWWRSRKPFRRAAKKRAECQSLLPLFHT